MRADSDSQPRPSFARADRLRSWRRLRPLRIWSPAADPLSPLVQTRLFIGLLALGLVARGLRYALRFPLWEDECFLVVNLIDGTFADLAGPLRYHQVAPVLFLWVEALAVGWFGFNELALRLFPFVSSVGALLLFAWVVRRTVRGTAGVLALAFFAPAYPGIRYAAEAKQYGSDLLVGLALVALAVGWWRNPRRTGWLWAIAIAAPVGVQLSYPGTFVAGGLLAWSLGVLWSRRQRAGVAAWVTYAALTLVSFAVLLGISARHQAASELDFMQQYWGSAFPPMAKPWLLPWWLLVTHASELLAWPVGGARGASALTFVCVVAGIWLTWRRRRFGLLALCVLPALVHLAAAALERYPYGGHVKFSLDLAAPICLLGGIGAAALVWLRRGAHDRGRGALFVLVGALAFTGVGSIVRDCLHPYKTLSDERARAFAQWFWLSADFDGDVRCLEVDEHLELSRATWTELSWAAMYRCNQAIYRPDPPLTDAEGSGADPPPTRYIVFRDPRQPFDEAALERWLAARRAESTLVSRVRYPVPRYDKRERRLIHVDTIEIFTFVP